MRKSLIVLFSVMVVLAFAASAFALHAVKSSEYTPGLVKAGKSQIELGGEIRIRGDYSKNVSDFDDDKHDTTQKYDQRVRLRTKANVTDMTMGVVELETTDNQGTRNKNSYTWGCSTDSKCADSATEKKRDALYIRQAYIAHQFGTIGGIKAGHMLLGLGNRLFFDHTNYGDDALLGYIAVGPGELSLIDIKLAERDNATLDQNDDYEAYVVALEMPVGPANVSADVTYLRDRDKDTYDEGTHLVNIGIRADADLKVVKVKGDVEFQTGTAKEDAAGNNVKHQAMAALLGVEANVGPATIRGGAAYGTGSDIDDDVDESRAFKTFLTDNQYSTFIYDYSVKGASGAKNVGLTNTTYVNVGASVKPIADLKISADAYYLIASKKVLNGAGDETNKLGFEVDGKVEYQVASNLVYFMEAGILVAGDAYDSADENSDNPYRVRHGLLLQF